MTPDSENVPSLGLTRRGTIPNLYHDDGTRLVVVRGRPRPEDVVHRALWCALFPSARC